MFESQTVSILQAAINLKYKAYKGLDDDTLKAVRVVSGF
jgi:hypothetical protein